MSKLDAPQRGIVRVAYTPRRDPDATVITEAHHHTPQGCETPLEALRRSTRFELQPNDQTCTAWQLPDPIIQAMRIDPASPATEFGALHVWCWADDDEDRGPFLSWFMPSVGVGRAEYEEDRGLRVELILRHSKPYMLPYLAQLPADERPDPQQWQEDAFLVVWPVDALPAVTHPLAPA